MQRGTPPAAVLDSGDNVAMEVADTTTRDQPVTTRSIALDPDDDEEMEVEDTSASADTTGVTSGNASCNALEAKRRGSVEW